MSGKPEYLGDPGSVVLLGSVVSLGALEPSGREVAHTWSLRGAPGLLWSPKKKTLLIFPKMSFSCWVDIRNSSGPASGPALRKHRLDMREAASTLAELGVEAPKDLLSVAKLYTEWAARPPTKFAQYSVSDRVMYLSGTAKDIVYVSDKWNGENGERVHYIHKFSNSGTVKLRSDKHISGHEPSCFTISGGRLTVTHRGIIY